MTTTIPSSRFVRSKFRSRRKAGFSLVEVVVATGLCTYALLVIACLLPMGSTTFQVANQNVVQSEIFNKIQLELNATPYYTLPDFPRFTGGKTTYGTGAGTGLSYFNGEGEEILSAGTPAGAIYFVRCVRKTSSTSATPADGLGMNQPPSSPVTDIGGPTGLVVVVVQIGYHVDPNSVPATDSRVATRSFVIAKRDTANGS